MCLETAGSRRRRGKRGGSADISRGQLEPAEVREEVSGTRECEAEHRHGSVVLRDVLDLV